MMNHISCSNASSKMIASNIDMSQENSNARLQRSRNDEEKIADIINLLIKTSTLKKEISKDYSWKDLMSLCTLVNEGKSEMMLKHR